MVLASMDYYVKLGKSFSWVRPLLVLPLRKFGRHFLMVFNLCGPKSGMENKIGKKKKWKIWFCVANAT